MDYGYLTLVAPILTLAVAIATRKVPLAMLVGIFTGQLIIWRMESVYRYQRKRQRHFKCLAPTPGI